MRLYGTIKFFYNQAATTGQAHRLVFDFEGQTVTIEAAEGVFVAPRIGAEPEDDEADEEEDVPEAVDEEASTESSEEGEEDAEAAPAVPTFTSPTKAIFGPASGPSALTRPYQIPAPIELAEICNPLYPEPISNGTAYLNIYPNGYADHVAIILSNEDRDRYVVIETNPLTGSSRVTRTYPEGGLCGE